MSRIKTYQDRKFRCNERKFLNLDGHHANASIVALVERGNKKSRRRPWVHLSLSDCTNQINLEFDLYSADDRINARHKVDTLVTSLTKFRDALTVELNALDAADDTLPEEDY